MRKNFILGFVGVILLSLIAFGVHFTKQSNSKVKTTTAKINHPKVVDVDEVAKYPDRFMGPIGIAGQVAKINEPESYFTLGCDDACILLPVKFTGKMPEPGNNIVVYGKVKVTEDGKYIFYGQKIKAK